VKKSLTLSRTCAAICRDVLHENMRQAVQSPDYATVTKLSTADLAGCST